MIENHFFKNMIKSQFKMFKTFDKAIFPNAIGNFTLSRILLDFQQSDQNFKSPMEFGLLNLT